MECAARGRFLVLQITQPVSNLITVIISAAASG
jgi:hypothetical protein